MNALPPSDAQLDALREVANIGCGHAANALARLMGDKTVQISVPRVLLLGAKDVSALFGGNEAEVVCARLRVEGGLEGLLLLVLSAEDARALQALLLPQDARAEDAESALLEVANILASACLSAIGSMTGWRLMPSVPTLERDTAEAVLARALGAVTGRAEQVMVLEARFSALSVPPIAGQLLLLLDGPSSASLLTCLHP